MKGYSVVTALGDYYATGLTGYSRLKFTLQNATDVTEKLTSFQWVNSPPLYDRTASKETIIAKLNEVIDGCAPDDWILFYYTGHAARTIQLGPNGESSFLTYCVTFTPALKHDSFPGVEAFFSERDYDQIISRFQQRVPDGHLITVLDCCNAFGLIENFARQTDYHTIIAACSDGRSAAYNTNSAFFTAFKKCWDLPFKKMSSRLKSLMENMQAPNTAKVQIATKFMDYHLNLST